MNYLAIQGRRQSGKTRTLIKIAVTELLEGRRILYASIRGAESRNAFEQALATLSGIPGLVVRRTNGQESITLGDGVIRFVSVNGRGYRGVSVDTLMRDDAYAYTPDQLADLVPSVNASDDPRVYDGVLEGAL